MKNCTLKNNLDEMENFPRKTQTTKKDSRRNRRILNRPVASEDNKRNLKTSHKDKHRHKWVHMWVLLIV